MFDRLARRPTTTIVRGTPRCSPGSWSFKRRRSRCVRPPAQGRDERRCARIERLLEETKQQAQAKRNLRERWKDWRNGGPIERGWRNVHSAEILLAEVIGLGELSSQRPAVRSMAKRVLPAKDARSQAIEQWLSDKMWNKLPERDDTALF